MKTPIDDVLVAALQAENRCLRAELAAAREEFHFQACLTKVLMPYQERAIKAEADLAAARALLLEARGWLDTWESRQSALRDRIDAALGGDK